ncbi:MAG: hypothetical protein LBP29_04870 [Treponema sp.]|jgi:hypothetical protein|nr:hypothetical protein [Treponema sp.]
MLFGNFFTRKLCLLAAAVGFVLTLLFAGCENGSTDPGEGLVPNALEGNWFSEYAEEYKISETEFVSMAAGAVSYRGTILNIRSDSASNTAGYITILYTVNSNDTDAVGNYYVIRWENLENGTVSLAGAFNSSVQGKGYGTREEAETAYMGAIGAEPFSGRSDCLRMLIQSRPTPIMGSWSSDYGAYTITDKTISYYYGTYLGEIVNVRPIGENEDKGYITFKYLMNTPNNQELIGYYGVLYWELVDEDTAYICAAYSNSSGDEGKATQQEAEQTYVIENADDFFYDYDAEEYEPPQW